MSIWWTDESPFKVEELCNYNNRSYYALDNMHLKLEKPNRQKFVNVWAGIRGDGKVLYKILEGKQNGKKYTDMLTSLFDEMDQNTSFFMQDGAGHHRSRYAIEWINANWKNRWIGLHSPRLEWPPLSHDLTPMDFSFWKYVKVKVAQCRPNNREQLIKSIKEVFMNIDPTFVISICQSVKERCRKCLDMNGGRFEK